MAAPVVFENDLRDYVMNVVLKENLQQDDFETGGENEHETQETQDFKADLRDLKVSLQEKYVAFEAGLRRQWPRCGFLLWRA